MQVEVTAGLEAGASASVGATASYVLIAAFSPASGMVPGGGVATDLVATPSGDASFASDPFPLNTSVADLRPEATVTSDLELYRIVTSTLVGASGLTAVPTLMKAKPRAAPPVVPGPGVVIPGPNTPSYTLTVHRRP
jgi:hypothetical protein